MDTKSLLRFTTTGSVDDGKSSLIGRLLYETNCIFEDQYAQIATVSQKRGQERVDLSLLLDGLASEREQGITIDVAYRYFTTPRRKFIIADTPGHEQYTRNMVTGASTADLAIILIDARNGVRTQSKRHGFLVSLLGIPHMIVAVNKMDLVDYSQDVFNQIVKEYAEFSEKLDIHDITFIPVSALEGDNVTTRSPNMGWYEGHTLLHLLETVHVSADRNLIDFRFPVQYVIRPHLDFRGFAGTLQSGTICPGEEVVILPSGKSSTVKSIVSWDGELKQAAAGQSIVLTLNDEIDISRGDMVVRKNNIPTVSNRFDAIICWMDEQPLDPSRTYILKHTSKQVKAFISKIHYKIDVNTLHRSSCTQFVLNEIGRVEFKVSQPLFFDSYRDNRGTGSFILIDPHTHRTVGGGIIRGEPHSLSDFAEQQEAHKAATSRSANVVLQPPVISREQWEQRNAHPSVVYWLTGLSGAGKSTIAKHLVSRLFEQGQQVVLLDGDNLRHGLCRDLGFDDGDRAENIRRVAETARLFFEQGTSVVCTFISPFESDRAFARSLIPAGRFVEIFVKCDVEICKRRDPKGLYRKALAGEIAQFTGINSPYEAPLNAELVVETDLMSPQEIVETVCSYVSALN